MGTIWYRHLKKISINKTTRLEMKSNCNINEHQFILNVLASSWKFYSSFHYNYQCLKLSINIFKPKLWSCWNVIYTTSRYFYRIHNYKNLKVVRIQASITLNNKNKQNSTFIGLRAFVSQCLWPSYRLSWCLSVCIYI